MKTQQLSCSFAGAIATSTIPWNNEFDNKFDSLDLDSVAQLLVNNRGWTYQQAEWAIADYKRYLLLADQNPGQLLIPTKEIDAVLHEHISLSAKFIEDCKRLFDRVLHHEANFGNGDDADRRAWLATFQQTRKLFKQLFGLDLTGEPARCYVLSLGSLS